MSAKAKKLLDDALALPEKERAALAAKIWDSLDAEEWESEMEKRVEDFKRGRVKGIPASEVLANLGRPTNASSRER